MTFSSARRRGFTLIEIMIVAALIALLSGISVFAIREMYESNIRKVTIGDCFQLATALSFAEQDLQFYPRLNHLELDKTRIFLDQTGTNFGNVQLVPRIDYFGFLTSTPASLNRIRQSWSGPYMAASATRNRSSAGGARSGIIKMRLPDVFQEEFNLVDWPADVWGQPLVLYLLKSHIINSVFLPQFIERENEEASFLNAVVSYGKNGFPGGALNTPGSFIQEVLIPGALFVEGDLAGTGPTFTADFTLKTATATDPRLRLDNVAANPNYQLMLRSLGAEFSPGQDPSQGEVGMLDPGSDDIVFEF